MSSEASLRLHRADGSQPPVELPRSGRLVVGSAPDKADLLLEAQGVADVHCAMGRTKDGSWAVKDLGSEFGTHVNGKRVAQARLHAGDQLLIGSVRLEVRGAEETAAEEPRHETRDTSSAAARKPRESSRSRPAYPSLPGYRILQRLGRGAMGEVFLAVQESLDREVALKVLSKKLEADATFVRSFQAEARSAAALNHPNVVTVHDVGEAGGVHYLTMEYMDRGSLEDRVSREGPLHWRAVLDVLHDAASGLVYAESRGIVHRDIKPDNLMQNHTGATKIADLGLATRESEPGAGAEGKIFGTPHFISPEQVRGEKADCRSDLYALGATAYRLLTGHTPFEGQSTREILRAKLTEDARPLRSHVTDIPEGLVQVVGRLLQRDPADRYPSASALLKELDSLRRGPEAATVGAPPSSANPLLKFALPALVVLLLAGGFFLFGGSDELPHSAPPEVAPDELSTDEELFGEAPPPDEGLPVPVDDDAQERLFEIEAENEFLKLAQRDLDAPSRRDRLREIAARYLGTTAATEAMEEADRLDAEILAADRAELEHETRLGTILAALRQAAQLDQRPFRVGNALRAVAAVPGQEELAQDQAFLTERAKLEDAILASGLAALEEKLAGVEEAVSRGDFTAAREGLTDALALTDLPDFGEGRVPQGAERVLQLRTELRARIEGLESEESEFRAAQARSDARALARSLAGPRGLGEDLGRLDFEAGLRRVSELTQELQTEPRRAWAGALAAELEHAARAFPILAKSWGSWRRKSVPDPREARGATREAVGVTDAGLRLEVKGAVQDVPWSAFAGETKLLATLFKDRLKRPFDESEREAIGALLHLSALTEVLRDAAEMFQHQSGAVFTPAEAEALPRAYERALEWERDGARRALLERERDAAGVLARALRAASDEDYGVAVSQLELLLEEYGDTLLVALTSDGSLASPGR